SWAIGPGGFTPDDVSITVGSYILQSRSDLRDKRADTLRGTGMAQAITPAMKELQTAVYKGAEDAGMQLPGRSDWGDFRKATTRGTVEGAPEVAGELTVAVGADGQLVNQARHRAPDDAPSTHLLKIDVQPSVNFGADGNVPHIRWTANVTVFELTKAHAVLVGDSDDEEARKALEGGRSYVEYMNDPDFREALLDMRAKSPREAVRVVLEKISSGGVVALPEPPNPVPDTGASANRRLAATAAIGAMVVAAIVGIVVLSTSSDPPDPATTEGSDQDATADTPAPGDTETGSAVSVEPTAPVEPSTPVPAPPSTPEPAVETTEFPILEVRCFLSATGEEQSEGCPHLNGVT
ncbi:MAG: hypothetical protein GY720_10545, partial [bacterium]|nr:hypothetical protein [bacterium]